MRFYVEQAPKGSWRVMLHGSSAPVSEHDTEEEARERLSAYLRGVTSVIPPADDPTGRTTPAGDGP